MAYAYIDFQMYENYQDGEGISDNFQKWDTRNTSDMVQKVVNWPGVEGHSIVTEVGWSNHPAIYWTSSYMTTGSFLYKFRSPGILDSSDSPSIPDGTPTLKEGIEEIFIKVPDEKYQTYDYTFLKVSFSWDTLTVALWEYEYKDPDTDEIIEEFTEMSYNSTSISLDFFENMDQFYMLRVDVEDTSISAKLWNSINPEPSSSMVSLAFAAVSNGGIAIRQNLQGRVSGMNLMNTTGICFIEYAASTIDTTQYISATISGTVFDPDHYPISQTGFQVYAFDKWERYPHIDAPNIGDVVCSVSSLVNGQYELYVEPGNNYYIAFWNRYSGWKIPEVVIMNTVGGYSYVGQDMYAELTPDTISTKAELWDIRFAPQKYFYLTADIDLTYFDFPRKTEHLADYGTWIPPQITTGGLIGYDSANSQYETRTISNATINQLTPDLSETIFPIMEQNYVGVGFFHKGQAYDTSGGPTVAHVDFQNISVSAFNPYVGILFGICAHPVVDYVNISGTIEVPLDSNNEASCNSVGGLAGVHQGGSSTRVIDFTSTDVSISGAGITDKVGGFIGNCYAPQIRRSYSKGTINVPNTNVVGGFVGTGNCNTEYCFSRASVTANSTAGGFAGELLGYTSEVYSTGLVTADGNYGGLASVNYGILINAYFNYQTAGTSAGPGTARTTEEMTYLHNTETTYLFWNFYGVWVEWPTKNDGYPQFENVWVARTELEGRIDMDIHEGYFLGRMDLVTYTDIPVINMYWGGGPPPDNEITIRLASFLEGDALGSLLLRGKYMSR